jgi:ABC-type transporter Mla maintaining outer membrane lipid asymmetry ATPase subunit MlaF
MYKEQDIIPDPKREGEIKIRQIFQMICQFGAVSGEKDLLDNIIKKMYADEITPEKAIQEAREILEDKNGFLTMYR